MNTLLKIFTTNIVKYLAIIIGFFIIWCKGFYHKYKYSYRTFPKLANQLFQLEEATKISHDKKLSISAQVFLASRRIVNIIDVAGKTNL